MWPDPWFEKTFNVDMLRGRDSCQTVWVPDVRRPYSVQVFLVAKQGPGWSVLVLQRNARPDLSLPEFWQGVSGALEPGESFEAAAVREVAEETSFILSSAAPTGYEQVYQIKPEWRSSYGPEPAHVCEKVFYARLSLPAVPRLSGEHKAFRWCSEAEAVDLLTFAQDAQCVQSVFQVLRSTDD
jgi:dATP pyrophosphohydrolase